jgi:hypothetical protein
MVCTLRQPLDNLLPTPHVIFFREIAFFFIFFFFDTNDSFSADG